MLNPWRLGSSLSQLPDGYPTVPPHLRPWLAISPSLQPGSFFEELCMFWISLAVVVAALVGFFLGAFWAMRKGWPF